MTAVPTTRLEVLADQLEFHWAHHLRPGLEGLTDDEYLWEPVAGTWSIRPRAEAVTALAAGAGDLVLDFDHPEPSPAPVTSIAWRLGHLLVGVFGQRNASHFGAPATDYTTRVWPRTADAALQELDAEHDRWVAGVTALGEAGLDRPCGPAEGPYADHSMAVLVLHIHREVIHHGAEILLLRDLYRHRR